MLCPFCGKDSDKVIDSRTTDGGRAIRRRRQCQACHRRYTTYEYVEKTVRLTVVKKDGTRVPYDRQKIADGVQKAAFKRAITGEQIGKLVDEVEEQLVRTHDREVASVDIGRVVADKLRRLDQVAYVRFASVYKQFRDIDDLLDEVRDMLENQPPDTPGQGKLF